MHVAYNVSVLSHFVKVQLSQPAVAIWPGGSLLVLVTSAKLLPGPRWGTSVPQTPSAPLNKILAMPLVIGKREAEIERNRELVCIYKRSENFDKRPNRPKNYSPMKKIALRQNRTANALPLNASSVSHASVSSLSRDSVRHA